MLALSFLTIIPVYKTKMAEKKEMANSLYFYPAVGFFIGGILAIFSYLGNFLFPGLGSEATVIVVWIIITGGLHLDGLMDSADGIFSGRDRNRKLEIMRDSRVGSMGAIALGVILLLKFAFLTSLPDSIKVPVLILAPAVGRFMMVCCILLFPYAREGPGLGKSFGDNAGKAKLVGALLVLLIGGFLLLKGVGLGLIAVTFAVAICISIWVAGILGGHTGDTYGAMCEVTETFFLMIAVAAVGLVF